MGFFVGGLAARQLADYRAHTPGTFFGEEGHPRLTLHDAYAVQAEVARLRAAGGGPVAGYKWALPARACASRSAWMA
jgi:2-keto-4-pentenoate hydratase